MTTKQQEKITDNARAEMGKKVREEYANKTIPAPANKATIKAYRKKWQKTLDDKLNLIERREWSKYYDEHPDDYQKDYNDVYYARFILRISDDDWNEYLK